MTQQIGPNESLTVAELEILGALIRKMATAARTDSGRNGETHLYYDSTATRVREQIYSEKAGAWTELGGMSLAGSDDTEQTTATTGNLNSVTGLTIPTTTPVLIEFDARSTSGASTVQISLTVNATDLGVVWSKAAVAEVYSGRAQIWLGKRDDSNYLGNWIGHYVANGTATANATGPIAPATTQPNAIITSVTANVSSNSGSLTVGVANLRVYRY